MSCGQVLALIVLQNVVNGVGISLVLSAAKGGKA